VLGPRRAATLLAATLTGGFLAATVVTAPAYAGLNCGTPVAVGDCTPPNTIITAEPPSSIAPTTAASFTVAVDPQESGDTFECKLVDTSGIVQDWTNCTDATSASGTSTGSKDYGTLALGTYTFSVRASDHPPVGNPNVDQTPATYTWDVVDNPPPDNDAPHTHFSARAPRWLLFPFVRVRYYGSSDTTDFACALNGRPQDVTDCSYDQADMFGLKGRDYRFTVAAIDSSGNEDLTPAVDRWTVPINNTFLRGYSRGWKEKSGHGYFEDSYSITTRHGASVQQGKRRFRSVVLVATKCPDCGSLEVRLGSRVLKHVDLHAAKRKQRRLIPIASWKRPHTGTVKVVVTSTGRDVIVEGLGLSRHP
jgi:hypothetical protein